MERAIVVGCTIVGNGAGTVSGGLRYSDATNTVVWGNVGAATYASTGVNCCVDAELAGVNNLTNDPRFVDAAGGDYRLASNSPCINRGLNAAVVGDTDLAGNARIQNLVVDMGCYESGAWSQWLDTDGDGMTDAAEVLAGTEPTNALSRLALTMPFWQAGAGVLVGWESVAGKWYAIDRATNPLSQAAFTNILSGVPGGVALTTITDTTATAEGPYFYRVRVVGE